MEKAKEIRLVLGDQLSHYHSWYKQTNSNVVYVLMEVMSEQEYASHHIQKVVGFFAAMRKFAEELKEKGHRVFYLALDDERNQQRFDENLTWIVEETGTEKVSYQLPDEYRLQEHFDSFKKKSEFSVQAVDSEHFLCEREYVKNFFEGKKTVLMESFYRQMRKDYDIMIVDGKPETGKWNYDAANRKKLPKNHRPPEPKVFEKDVTSIVELLEAKSVKTIGEIDSNRFIWPISRDESLALLEDFCANHLSYFGDFQDAMTTEYWSIYHSRLSFSLNTKMLHPLEVVKRVIEEWRSRKEEIDISQVEGYVRQIIGWREFMRGVYWAKMPEYASLNYFNHKRKLPDWFWTGDTKMKCLSHSIKQSLTYAYAHHIQRLMVIGNFSLLAGISPDEIDAWYLGIYIDALEWVEITNTRGMSQFADGGIVGTKPYVSSASYMNKMGNYCNNCHYSRSKKVGEKACPFNSLYWHFYQRHEDKLRGNPRIGMMYRVWDKMKNKQDIIAQAERHLENIESL